MQPVQAYRLAGNPRRGDGASGGVAQRRVRSGQVQRLRVRHGAGAHHDAAVRPRRHSAILGERFALPATVLTKYHERIMKVPLKWLADYVPLTLPVAELVERLTLAGLEVSGVRLLGVPVPEGLRVKSSEVGPVWDRDKIFVAEVLEVKPHPDA